MSSVFKTRHFAHWMRKTELTDTALYTAVIEMESGLIDADLGGGVVKKRVRCQAVARVAAHARWWQPTRRIAGFLYLGLRKTNVPMSARRNWKHYKQLLRIC